jgi:hypothetical protein
MYSRGLDQRRWKGLEPPSPHHEIRPCYSSSSLYSSISPDSTQLTTSPQSTAGLKAQHTARIDQEGTFGCLKQWSDLRKRASSTLCTANLLISFASLVLPQTVGVQPNLSQPRTAQENSYQLTTSFPRAYNGSR